MAIADDEKRFKILIQGVEAAVDAGRPITISRNDTARRFGRYIDTQKRFITMNAATFILTASIAVLGGPIAAAVALAGSVVGLALTTAWDRWSVNRSKGKYQKKKDAGLSNMATETLDIARPLPGGPTSFQSKKLNEAYSEVVSDVKNVLAKQGLTDIYNALANLDSDFQRLKKFITSPKIEGPWVMGTFGATRNPHVPPGPPILARSGPSAAVPPPRVAGTVRLVGCTDAVELWEALKLIDNRFQSVREVTAMIDEYVMYATLASSQYESDERTLLKAAWKTIEREHRARDGKVNCKSLFDAFNKSIKLEGLQEYTGRKFTSRTKDYCEWVYLSIPDFVKATWSDGTRIDMGLEVLRRTDNAKFQKAKADIAFKYIEAKQAELQRTSGGQMAKDLVKGYLSSVVAIPDLPGSWSDVAVITRDTTTGVGITVGSAYLTGILNGMQSDAWQIQFAGATQKGLDEAATKSVAEGNQDTAKSLLDPLTFSQGFTPGHAMLIASTVVKVAIEVANAAWNERKLATGNTLGLTGMRQQTIAERIGTLRTFAQKEIADYVANLEEWGEAHETLQMGSFPQKLPGAFLRHMKCVDAKYSNRTGQFFEELVASANEMSVMAQSQVNLAEEAVKKFVATTNHRRTCKGSRYCYGPATVPVKAWIKTLQSWDPSLRHGIDINQLNPKWEETPACPIEGDTLETFKQNFISTLPGHLKQRAWELEYGDDY